MTTVQITLTRVEKTKNYTKFAWPEDAPFEAWNKRDKTEYVPASSPLAKAKTIKVTLEVTEVNGEE